MGSKVVIASRLSELPPPPSGHQNWPWTVETSRDIYSHECDWPRISIVTPSFNQAAFIEETIRSILLQNYPNLQYIVIDGGSTDGTLEILEKYAPWIDYWVSEPDYGQSHALNKGLAYCDGDWFNWINSDDYLKPAALAKMVKAATDSNIRIVAGVTENIQDGIPFGCYSTTLPTHVDLPFFSLGVNQPGSLLRLQDVKACGSVREDLRLCMDLDLWLRLLLRYGHQCCKSIPDTVAVYRYHAASKTCSTVDTFALEEFALLTDLYEDLSNSHIPPSLKELRKKCCAKQGHYESDQSFEANALEQAYLERLIVSDSLLFRAIMRDSEMQEMPFKFLRKALEELRPTLKRLYGQNFARFEAEAWLRAMQNSRRVNVVGIIAVLRSLPVFAMIKELTRIAVRG